MRVQYTTLPWGIRPGMSQQSKTKFAGINRQPEDDAGTIPYAQAGRLQEARERQQAESLREQAQLTLRALGFRVTGDPKKTATGEKRAPLQQMGKDEQRRLELEKARQDEENRQRSLEYLEGIVRSLRDDQRLPFAVNMMREVDEQHYIALFNLGRASRTYSALFTQAAVIVGQE